jgi:hypothetical protein
MENRIKELEVENKRLRRDLKTVVVLLIIADLTVVYMLAVFFQFEPAVAIYKVIESIFIKIIMR